MDDLVAESFTRMLGNLRTGGGPQMSFLAYLLTIMWHTVYERSRHDRKVLAVGDWPEAAAPNVDPAVEHFEVLLVSRAFNALPQRWQTVLWHTEVEGDRPARVEPPLGISANSVAALAYRARGFTPAVPSGTCDSWQQQRLRLVAGRTERMPVMDFHLGSGPKWITTWPVADAATCFCGAL
jgi:hypothetical protein